MKLAGMYSVDNIEINRFSICYNLSFVILKQDDFLHNNNIVSISATAHSGSLGFCQIDISPPKKSLRYIIIVS